MATDNPTNQDKPPKPKPKGKALRWTESDMDALAEVTPADMERARQLIDKYGGPMLSGMQDATKRGGTK